MAHSASISSKYRSHTSGGSYIANLHMIDSRRLLGLGIVCAALFAALYVFETNALMFLERTMPVKERVLLETKNDVRMLEIQAAQLAASQAVQEVALSHAMVASRDVSYVSSGDNAVAMVPSTR